MSQLTRILNAVTAGLLVIAASLYYQQASYQPTSPPIPKVISYSPNQITIPALDINLRVKPATTNANDWVIYDDAASWLSTSGNLESGNIVIYSHNTDQLFGPIVNLAIGDQIIVEGDSRKQVYKVAQSFQGKSSDIHHITNTDNRLTLYTCSGLLDSKRHFVIAKK